jgi:hypothetical protein
MADDTEIERMLEEKMQEDEQTNKHPNGDKKEKDKDKKHKKHKHHKHHKSHKSEKKTERQRSRSPVNDRRRRSPTPPPPLPSGKRRDVNSELHQLAQTLNRNRHSKDQSLLSASAKANRREKSPELTPEERDLRTVFCKEKFFIKNNDTDFIYESKWSDMFIRKDGIRVRWTLTRVMRELICEMRVFLQILILFYKERIFYF